jgi:hypothetical protein
MREPVVLCILKLKGILRSILEFDWRVMSTKVMDCYRICRLEEQVKMWPDSLTANWWRRWWPITWTEESSNHYSIDFLVLWCIVGQGFLVIEASRLHSDTPHLVGLLWTSDRHDAGISNWQQTIITRNRYPCARLDSNQQSQHVRSRRPKP